MRRWVDLQAPERERNSATDRIGLERRLLHGIGPIGLVDRKANRALAVLDVGIEFDVAFDGRVVLLDRLHEAGRIDVLHAVDEFFKTVRADLGRASELVLVAQQRKRLRVEHLPGIASGLLQDGATIFSISVVAEIGAFVDEALAVGVHHQAEWITVAVAGGGPVVDVAVIARITFPRNSVTTGPLPVGLRADVERHAYPVAGVVAGAAHLRHVPAGAEIARAPFAIGLEPAAGEHNRAGAEDFFSSIGDDADALDALRAAQQRHGARAVADGDAMLGRGLVFRLHQAGAATIGIDDDAAEELELALVVVGLPAVVRQELDPASHQPVHGVRAVLDERLGQIGIDVVLRDATEIVEIVLS